MKIFSEIASNQRYLKCILIVALLSELLFFLVICILSYLDDTELSNITPYISVLLIILAFCLYSVFVFIGIYLLVISRVKELYFLLIIYIILAIVTIVLSLLSIFYDRGNNRENWSTNELFIAVFALKIALILVKPIVCFLIYQYIKITNTVNARLEADRLLNANDESVEQENHKNNFINNFNEESGIISNKKGNYSNNQSLVTITNNITDASGVKASSKKENYNNTFIQRKSQISHGRLSFLSQNSGTKSTNEDASDNNNNFNNQNYYQNANNNNTKNNNINNEVYLCENYSNTENQGNIQRTSRLTTIQNDLEDEAKDVVDSLKNNDFSNNKYTFGFHYLGEESLNSRKFSTPKKLPGSSEEENNDNQYLNFPNQGESNSERNINEISEQDANRNSKINIP